MASIIKVLPLEIISLIIEDLAGDEHPSQSLKSCSLSCQTFLPLCQRALFREISLLDDRTKSIFVELAQQSPWLAQHVRELAYAPKEEDCIDRSEAGTSILAFLRIFKKLRCITITFPGSRRSSFQDWKQLSPSMQSTLISLMHLPLITSIRLRNIVNFDYFDLAPCIGLRELDLHEVSPMELGNTYAMIYSSRPVKPIQLHSLKLTDQHSNEKQVTPSFTEIAKIVKFNRNDSASILDLQGLTDVAITQLVDLGVAANIIKSSRCLKSVILGFSYRPQNMILVVPAILSSLKTLTHLSLKPRRYHRLNTPNLNRLISSICQVLRSLDGQNIISVLKIDFNFIQPTRLWRRYLWQNFEFILLGAGWQSLNYFQLNFNFSHIANHSDIVNGMHRLPEFYMPRLLSSNSIEFKFCIQRKGVSIEQKGTSVSLPSDLAFEVSSIPSNT